MLKIRYNLESKFRNIQNNIRCLHSHGEAMCIANAILNEQNEGPVVECGCFMGGMTCKLSIACKIAKKKLYVFDSFSGSPYDEQAICYDSTRYLDGFNGIKNWHKGAMSCSLENVISNVKKYGDISSCSFIPGLFSDTLKTINIYPSLVFMDVDLRESARQCLKYFWPRLKGKYFFTHEMWFKDYVEYITNKDWWLENFNCLPPKLVGAEKGLDDAYDLGYFKKEKK